MSFKIIPAHPVKGFESERPFTFADINICLNFILDDEVVYIERYNARKDFSNRSNFLHRLYNVLEYGLPVNGFNNSHRRPKGSCTWLFHENDNPQLDIDVKINKTLFNDTDDIMYQLFQRESRRIKSLLNDTLSQVCTLLVDSSVMQSKHDSQIAITDSQVAKSLPTSHLLAQFMLINPDNL